MIDLNKAPEGATHYRAPNGNVYFYKESGSCIVVWSRVKARWFPSRVFKDVSSLQPIPEQK